MFVYHTSYINFCTQINIDVHTTASLADACIIFF